MSGTTALFVSAVIGAVVTALATAGATWFVADRLEKSATRRRLLDSVAIVLAELDDNRDAIERYERKEFDVASLRDGRLTIGDWTANKKQLAALAAEDEELWDELTDLYSELHTTIRHGTAPPPASQLQALVSRLASRSG